MITVSEEIILKPLSHEHAPLIFHMLDSQREYMRPWLPFVDYTQEVTDTQMAIATLIDGVNEQFSIFYKGEFVGLVGFKDTDFGNKKTEIGYWMSQDVQGKGIMTRSVQRLLQYAFEEKELNRIQIKVATDNKKSRAIPERLGFTQEGIERDGELLVDNRYTDIVIYSILKREYIQ